jgi:hypothetical protein
MDFFSYLSRKSSTPETSLTDIRIASPCPADWEKMIGDERTRHCSKCNLNVYNLSAMTERQAMQLVAANEGQRLCLRLYRRTDGTVMTRDCPWSVRAVARKFSRLASAALTVFMSATMTMAKNKPHPATCECRLAQQQDSEVRLTVTDQHGAVIPNANITLETKADKDDLYGTTGAAGEWRRLKLPPGPYQMTVKAPGFRAYKGTVDVREGTLIGLKVKLPLAEVNTTITVEAEPSVVQGTTVGILTSESIPAFPPSSSSGQRSPMRP